MILEEWVTDKRQQELLRMAEIGAIASAIRQGMREAILAERERCAKIVERGDGDSLEHVARMIRDDS